MMYFVGLKLQGPVSGYPTLTTALQALGPWSNRLDNTWLVECRLSARQIRDVLKVHLKPGDRLFIGEFNQNWAGTNMGNGFPEWLNRRTFRTTTPSSS
jgi:hypothetical protein